jgi:hypothetical protein
VAILAAAILLGGGGKVHSLVDRWKDPDFQRRKFNNLLVVAITEDKETRRNFENKFVSQLRGRGVMGVTSHSIVPDLQKIPDKAEVLQKIDELEIDGAISIRVVPLKDLGEKAWATGWRAGLDEESDLRRLIDESLPVADAKGSKFGVEVALWISGDDGRIWAARTSVYTKKELRKGGGEFVQLVMNALEYEELM